MKFFDALSWDFLFAVVRTKNGVEIFRENCKETLKQNECGVTENK